eukprot:Plantae.Rhodophyta-Purpureofilum_apyrenoidigerum.ctg2248.p1 GENE.Plantae.Rhodophyta-Purpureofilum_apyrenoidigerum.ctg2248~~Plantae.Rhodophyta-Purpureofilum_apyrenoidigerum.ctg2248.p1  ORF type:complete len:657 (+),score=98.82 Plantae.Rhodophyta-Purpureofilum_apyrenoidigerum.ctg2248:253-1971(+)
MTFVYELVKQDNGTLSSELRFRLDGFGQCVAIKQNYGMATHSNGSVAIFTGNSGEDWSVVDTVDTGVRATSPSTFGNVCSLSLSHAVVVAQEFQEANGGPISAIWLKRPKPDILECGSVQNGKCVKDDATLAGAYVSFNVVLRLSGTQQLMVFNSETNTVSLREVIDEGSVITTEEFLSQEGSKESLGLEQGADYANGTLVINSRYIRDVNSPGSFISLDSIGPLSHIHAMDTSTRTFVGVTGSTFDASEKTIRYFSVSGEQVEERLVLTNAKAGAFVGSVSAIALGRSFVALGSYDDTVKGDYSAQGVYIWEIPANAIPSSSPPAATPTASSSPTPDSSPTTTPISTPTPASTPTASDTPESPSAADEENTTSTADPCFAADSKVVILQSDGSEKSVQLSELRPGDTVESFNKLGQRVFSEIAFIQHDQENHMRDLLEFRAQDAELNTYKLRVHEGHYLINNLQPTQFVLAADLKVGDKVLVMTRNGSSTSASIVSIKPTQFAVRNIVTMNDYLVVDGILGSSFTNVLQLRPLTQALLLAPLKIFYAYGLRTWPVPTLMLFKRMASSVYGV